MTPRLMMALAQLPDLVPRDDIIAAFRWLWEANGLTWTEPDPMTDTPERNEP